MIQTHSSSSSSGIAQNPVLGDAIRKPKLSDLKKDDLTVISNLSNIERFIRNYGAFNCKYLWLKNESEVLQILSDKYPTEPLNECELSFVKENSGKKVLVYLCHTYETYPDIFIFGNDNIAFTTECFTSIA